MKRAKCAGTGEECASTVFSGCRQNIPSRIIWKLRINRNSFIVPCRPAGFALFSCVFEVGIGVFKLDFPMVGGTLVAGDRCV